MGREHKAREYVQYGIYCLRGKRDSGFTEGNGIGYSVPVMTKKQILETLACCLIGAAIGLAFAFSLPG